MDNLPETSEEGTVAVAPQSELRDSNTQLMKTLTFGADVIGPEPSAIRFSFTSDTLIEEAGEDWINDIEEEDRNRNEEEEEQQQQQGGEEEEEHEAEEEDDEENPEEDDEENPEEDSGTEEDEDEEEESKEESDEEGHEEERVLIDYQFPIAKEVKVKSDSDLSKIPSEVCWLFGTPGRSWRLKVNYFGQVFEDRNGMLQLLKDLVAERPDLTLRNRYLEYKSFRHLQTVWSDLFTLELRFADVPTSAASGGR